MFEIPEAAPTSFCSTLAVEIDEAGPFCRLIPTASATSGRTNVPYAQESETRVKTPNATVMMMKPATMVARAPILATIGVINGVKTTAAAATGSRARPASSAFMLRALGFWKYRLRMYMIAFRVPDPIRMEMVAPTRILLRSRFRSSSGAAIRFSTRTKAIAAAIDTRKQPVGSPAATVSLRGMVNVVMRVEALRNEVHSGLFGGPAPDALTALVEILATLHDESGQTTVTGLDNKQRWSGEAYPP